MKTNAQVSDRNDSNWASSWKKRWKNTNYLDLLGKEFTGKYPFERSIVNQCLCEIKRILQGKDAC